MNIGLIFTGFLAAFNIRNAQESPYDAIERSRRLEMISEQKQTFCYNLSFFNLDKNWKLRKVSNK